MPLPTLCSFRAVVASPTVMESNEGCDEDDEDDDEEDDDEEDEEVTPEEGAAGGGGSTFPC